MCAGSAFAQRRLDLFEDGLEVIDRDPHVVGADPGVRSMQPMHALFLTGYVGALDSWAAHSRVPWLRTQCASCTHSRVCAGRMPHTCMHLLPAKAQKRVHFPQSCSRCI